MKMHRFMRLIIFFDLPTETSIQLRNYRKFTKFLKSDGYIRIQYSVYSKLCINSDSARVAAKRLVTNAPVVGDVRYMIVTERQFQNIENINQTYTLQEKITTTNRTIMIGEMNYED